MLPGGKLYVPGAEEIIPNLARLTSWAEQHGILTIASMCAHREGDPEFSQFPPHCLVGTTGQKKIPETVFMRQYVVPNEPVELPPGLRDEGQVIVEKQQFDVFTNPNTEALLSRIGGPGAVVLYGVVTEICVACAARGLLDRGFKILLVRDAIHHLDEAKGRATVDEIQSRGGVSVTTDEVFTRSDLWGELRRAG